MAFISTFAEYFHWHGTINTPHFVSVMTCVWMQQNLPDLMRNNLMRNGMKYCKSDYYNIFLFARMSHFIMRNRLCLRQNIRTYYQENERRVSKYVKGLKGKMMHIFYHYDAWVYFVEAIWSCKAATTLIQIGLKWSRKWLYILFWCCRSCYQ